MFCKFCGKQIADGEVCFCDQAVAQRTAAAQSPVATAAPAATPAASIDVGAIVGKILGSFKALFKNTNYIGSDLTTPIAFSVTSLVLHILSWLCLKSMLLDTLGDLLKDMLGAVITMMGGSLGLSGEGTTGSFVWCGVLSFLIPLAFFTLIPVVGNLVRKEQVDFRKAFACAAAASMIPSMMFMVAGLVGLVIPTVGYFLVLAAALAGIINCAKLASKQIRGNTAVSMVLIALVVAAMVGLTAYIESDLLKDIITKIFENLNDLGDLFG